MHGARSSYALKVKSDTFILLVFAISSSVMLFACAFSVSFFFSFWFIVSNSSAFCSVSMLCLFATFVCRSFAFVGRVVGYVCGPSGAYGALRKKITEKQSN